MITAYPRRLPQSLSATALDLYERCPRNFALRYLTDVPDRRMPTPSLVLGNVVHAACASYMRLPPRLRCLDQAHRLLRSHWSIANRDAFIHPDEERAWGERGLSMMAAFVDRPDSTGRPFAVEEWVRATLPGGRRVCGRIDRADQTPDGLVVFDYKTGRRPPDFDPARETAAQLYALGCLRTFRLPVQSVCFLWLGEGREDDWHPDPDGFASIEDVLSERCEQLTTDRTMSPRPGPLCTGCGYRDRCPAIYSPTAPPLPQPEDGALPF